MEYKRIVQTVVETPKGNGPIVFSRPMADSVKTQFEQMMDCLNDAEAFLAGEQEGFKAHVPQEVDVKAIRNRLGMTQAKFLTRLGSASTPSSTGREGVGRPKRRLALSLPSSTRIPLPCSLH